MKATTKARHIHKILVGLAEETGYSGINLPTLNGNKVVWESGPFEWAYAALGGSSIYSGGLGDYSLTPERRLQMVLKTDPHRDGIEVQCENNYTLGVYSC